MKLPFDPNCEPIKNDNPLKPIDFKLKWLPKEIPSTIYNPFNDTNVCSKFGCGKIIEFNKSCHQCRRYM